MSPNKRIHFWIYPNFEQRLTQFFRELSAWKEIPFPRSITRKENPSGNGAYCILQTKIFQRRSSDNEIGHVQIFGSIFTKYHLNVALYASWFRLFESNHILYIKKSRNPNRAVKKEKKTNHRVAQYSQFYWPHHPLLCARRFWLATVKCSNISVVRASPKIFFLISGMRFIIKL